MSEKRIAAPSASCAAMKTIAALTLTAPDGIGRTLVRSTLASKSRSTMSLKVQPAPRITTAPMPNSTISRQSGQRSAAKAMPHQHGKSSSQVPIGRSSRASRIYGRSAAGTPPIDPIAGTNIGAKLGHAVGS